MKEYSLIDVLYFSFKILYQEIKSILLALSINLVFFFLVYYYLSTQTMNHSTLIIKHYMNHYTLLILALFIPISFMVNTFLTVIIEHHFLKIHSTLLDKIICSLKYYILYIKGILIIVFILLGILGISFMFMFTPFLNEIVLVLSGLTIVFFLGYFRFIPYTAILNKSTKHIFLSTEKAMNGHLLGSLFILLCLGVVTEFFSILSIESIITFLSKRTIKSFYPMISYFLLFQIITIYVTISDIIYITLGYIKNRPT